MTTGAALVVRYDEARRASAETTLHKLARGQGISMLALGVLLGLLIVVPFGAALIETNDTDVVLILAAIALLLVPITLGVLGVRQLRRQPRLPEIAVTITSTAVTFPAMDRPSGLAPRIRAEEWARDGTSASIIPASGLQGSRIEFTRQDAGKRRRRSIATGNVDVDPRVIVDALRGPHTP
ncbi:hypothetical protein ACUWEX_01005 [Okibacterium fritillariae]|uniref:hypothetical protein n=1 Tax=Okibacterium fritillariae TaxID=123320 RepID=UPI00405573A9